MEVKFHKFFYFLENAGKDPSALAFEDKLTGLYNRRYLFRYLKNRVNWETIEDNPLCLLMINADHLKRINEKYGQNAGDQAIVNIAEFIRQASPKNSVPVRYAGDSFLLLLPECSKASARSFAGKVLRMARKNGFSPQETKTPLQLTVSIGIAGAPCDARDGKSLIQRAETAMCQAKHSGRDQSADAGEPVMKGILSETLRRHLDTASIEGRKEQLSEISSALEEAAKGNSRFIIVEGAPGSGKTTFLDTIQKKMQKAGLKPVRISGTTQEAFRPYYLASYAAMGLMKQLHDKGSSILESMEEDEISRLTFVIPQLGGLPQKIEENGPEHRKALFTSFTKFLTGLADKRPLVLLIDNFHFCDQASLHLLRMLLKSEDLLVFICAAAPKQTRVSRKSVPLDLFRIACSKETGIQTIALSPLSESDIERHLSLISVGIAPPKGLSREMAAITRGIPMFFIEIIREMIGDGKIYRNGAGWRISAPEKEYFPESLDQIVRGRLELLDERTLKFLELASAFGESVFLSLLAGITREPSAGIYEIINTAEKQCLVNTRFEENDENIRFSSKQIRDIIYEGIPPEERKLLHLQIGVYLDKLYEQNLLPSAAFPYYHFARSTDAGKARHYREYLENDKHSIFDEKEIKHYTQENSELPVPSKTKGVETAEGTGTEKQGSKHKGLRDHNEEPIYRAKRIISLIMGVHGQLKLYEPGGPAAKKAVSGLTGSIRELIGHDHAINFSRADDSLLINGVKPDDTGYEALFGGMARLLANAGLTSLTFSGNMLENELEKFFNALLTPHPEKPESLEPRDPDIADMVRSLYLKKENKRLSSALLSMTEKYSRAKISEKKGILENFNKILHPAGWQPSNQYIKLIAEYLIFPVFEAEKDAERAGKLSDMLYEASVKLILRGDYRHAAEFFARIRRHPDFAEDADFEAVDRPRPLGKNLDPEIADTLLSSLKAAEKRKRQDACRLISSMGNGMVPMLVGIIIHEPDINARRLAAGLLGRMGGHGAQQLRRYLAERSRAEEKSRILEVIDSVTTDLAMEIESAIKDSREPVRKSAFSLAARADAAGIDSLLAELARGPETGLAIEAINTIGRRKSVENQGMLIELLAQTKNPDVLVEICRAMGRIGSSDFIQPLAGVLIPKRKGLWRRKYPVSVRIEAARAVCSIPGEHVQVMMHALKSDPDVRVRQAVSGTT